MKVIAFFNNKGGVGKTSLVYHLAWMYAELDRKLIVADLDPQANLSSMFLPEERLEQLWPNGEHTHTIYGAIQPLWTGLGDIAKPHVEKVANDKIGLLVGDLQLSLAEDDLNSQWPDCLDGKERSFRVISAFYRLIKEAAGNFGTDLVLIDVGPNLGAINRAALIAADYVVIPVASDIFSLQGLRNLGPTLRRWRKEWNDRLNRAPESLSAAKVLPNGRMEPVGYVILQHAIRLDRPIKAYERWMAKIPTEYHQAILDEKNSNVSLDNDTACLARLKHYRSLMPLAQEARKPMFLLKPADGAIGSHANAAKDCYEDFKALAKKISEHCKLG